IMDKLRFGTAGIPLSTGKPSTENGINRVKELGLECMELEFVHSIHVTKEKAPLIADIAKKNNVVLTCHAPYFVNLNSSEPKKYHASISYIATSAKITSLCHGYSVCFHAGYYMKMEKEKVYAKIKEGVKEIVKIVKEVDDKIWIRPEVAGKVLQFGDIDEVLKLSSEIEQVLPCIDFAHLHARSNGKYNTLNEFREIFEKTEKNLGKKALENMHIHMSGIRYSEKGERNHLELKDSDMNYKDLIKIFKEFKIKGVVVSESPNIEKDALLMKRIYENK
ncbi:MAG: Endonuclease IV, partial [candidate division CPR2 bacterium GW2011_GWC2_39_10]